MSRYAVHTVMLVAAFGGILSGIVSGTEQFRGAVSDSVAAELIGGVNCGSYLPFNCAGPGGATSKCPLVGVFAQTGTKNISKPSGVDYCGGTKACLKTPYVHGVYPCGG
jgi:hypothetical protein